MTKLEILYDEYQSNELLHENFTFDEVLDLYEEWKASTQQSFNSFIQNKLDNDEDRKD